MKQVILRTCEDKEIKYDAGRVGFEPLGVIPCMRCGICCSKWQPPVDAEEIAALARGLGIPSESFYRDYVEPYPLRPGSYLLRRKGKSCIFLYYEGEKATCTVHTFKPAACRNWMPSLSRPECREGLKRGKNQGSLFFPGELCASADELKAFYASLASNQQTVQKGWLKEVESPSDIALPPLTRRGG